MWHSVDLLDQSQTSSFIAAIKPTHLMHLAWYVRPGNYSSPENLLWVESSLHLLRQFHEHGGKRAVMGGSGYEYDWNYGYCKEGITPTGPTTFYGTAKSALQEITAGYSQSTGLSNAWGRVFFLYGPREDPVRLVASVIRSLLLSQPARCSHGEQIRDYMHVQDVADALVALVDSEVQGPVNIASGRPVALKDIIQRIGNILGKPELIQLGALPARANDVPLVVANIDRLSKEVGWKEKYDLLEGLTQTIDWWKKQIRGEAGTR
jgi:nucleoside-diphosphate-sugar epimerase